ncbi:AlbA family DNA-binding domain-containing protein [Thiothrix subterranea]|uniref:AlbA family DNA-binding domain-containing protein n=1 Tax=Thiothrix subterranea TaxID=2735563 RepID=UPI00280B84CF|nr:ATP-binding protein [Thiothrix subterranea]
MLDSTDNLLKQIALGEDSTLELKAIEFKGAHISAPHRNSLADEMAAMANSNTGVIVLGVDDKTKTISGIPVEKIDTVETWVREIANDQITPPLLCRIRKLAVPSATGGETAIIQIDIPRSLFVHQSPGGYLYRIGSSKRQMTPDALARLFQQRSQARIIRYDEQAVPQASLDDLKTPLWQRFRSPLSPKDDREFLSKLKLITRDEDCNLYPTVSGILMATDHPPNSSPTPTFKPWSTVAQSATPPTNWMPKTFTARLMNKFAKPVYLSNAICACTPSRNPTASTPRNFP